MLNGDAHECRGPACTAVTVKRVSEVDFARARTLEQLSALVQELVQLEQGEFGDQTALEVHTAKTSSLICWVRIS